MADIINGRYVTDLSTFYPVRYGLYGAMSKSEGIMPQELSYDGGDGDEDYTEYENEASEVGGVPEQDLPRFRTLVKNKKLELKSQYGKGYYSVTERFKKRITCIRDCDYFEVGNKVSIAIAVGHPRKTKWVSGWRKRWREFKKSGGLSQLKLQARGASPINSINIPAHSPATLPIIEALRPTVDRSGTGNNMPSQNTMRQGSKAELYVTVGIVIAVIAIAVWMIMKTMAQKAT